MKFLHISEEGPPLVTISKSGLPMAAPHYFRPANHALAKPRLWPSSHSWNYSKNSNGLGEKDVSFFTAPGSARSADYIIKKKSKGEKKEQ